MTILAGERTLAESWEDFVDRCDVDTAEIAHALPPEAQEKALEIENELREQQEGREPTDDITEVDEELLEEAIHADVGQNQMIIRILEDREREYVHLYDGMIHTIVAVFDSALTGCPE